MVLTVTVIVNSVESVVLIKTEVDVIVPVVVLVVIWKHLHALLISHDPNARLCLPGSWKDHGPDEQEGPF
jgi:hypothetical protein